MVVNCVSNCNVSLVVMGAEQGCAFPVFFLKNSYYSTSKVKCKTTILRYLDFVWYSKQRLKDGAVKATRRAFGMTQSNAHTRSLLTRTDGGPRAGECVNSQTQTHYLQTIDLKVLLYWCSAKIQWNLDRKATNYKITIKKNVKQIIYNYRLSQFSV